MPKKKVKVKEPQSNIKKLREGQNLTQAQLAVFIGVSENTIQNWEKNIGLANLEKVIRLCTTLNCKVEDLINYVDAEVEVDDQTKQKTFGFLPEDLLNLRKRNP